MKKLLFAVALFFLMVSGGFAQRFNSPFDPMVNANSPWWFNPNNIYYTPVPAPLRPPAQGQQFYNGDTGFYNPYYSPYQNPYQGSYGIQSE